MEKLSWEEVIDGKKRFINKKYKDKIVTTKENPKAEGDSPSKVPNVFPTRNNPNTGISP